MPASALEAVPSAVLSGLALAATFTVVAAGLFVAGQRLFPDGAPAADGRTYSSEERRRAEIRRYLTTIDERYVEGREVAGDPVDFYLPERDVAVTFDAQAFFRIRTTTDTRAVLVEHELPGRHLGRRLPFDVPEPEHESRPGARGRDRRAFEALGLPPTAGREEVRSAYRERVKDVHPDHGGDEESFREIREAYVRAREYAD